LSNWGFFGAWSDGRPVGGAAVAFRTPGLFLLEGRDDLAVLWDIRVASDARRLGVGSALFRAAAGWATVRGCSHLKAETQNVNVPACQFYARQGCELGAIQRFVYPTLPGEAQLLWYQDLGSARPVAGSRRPPHHRSSS
jgi:GNAT superfamily N-acetyltransferase